MFHITGKHMFFPWSYFLRWNCIRCGHCCIALRVHLTKDEATYFRKKYGDVVETINGKYVLKHKQEGGCIFLNFKNGIAECKIYKDRPIACQLFPFYVRPSQDITDLTEKIKEESKFVHRSKTYYVFVSNICQGLGRGPPIIYAVKRAVKLKSKHMQHNEKDNMV
ncbi:MAG: YkgJ family cysteine cluster protein [Candidatus Asgardarchaeum californiense]|nr:MAG: YkgJ family cysteine cluster protein [Candidatus Asgardarchaeum californiense]